MMGGPLGEKLQNMPQEDRAKLFTGTDEERATILKGAGFTDEEIQQISQMRQQGGGGRGPGGGGRGGGGGGGGRGGFGGGGAGGPGQ